jgi:hypothetical protein
VGVTKEEFEAECRRILMQYIPAAEAGRLRAHYREFIRRNLSRSAAIRAKILQLLKKYDISDRSGLAAQFNRERDEITEEKLRDIEQAAGEDEE